VVHSVQMVGSELKRTRGKRLEACVHDSSEFHSNIYPPPLQKLPEDEKEIGYEAEKQTFLQLPDSYRKLSEGICS